MLCLEAAKRKMYKKINPAELRGLGKKITGTSYLPFLKAFRHRQKIFTTNNHYEWSK
jgi:hypothetical protein